MTRTRRESDERGVALLLVLAFVAVLGLLVASVLAASGTTFVAAGGNRMREARVFRVNSGIEYGLQLLRGEGSFCLKPSGSPAQLDLSIDGGPVTLTCSISSGSTAGTIGTGGWALFVDGGSVANVPNTPCPQGKRCAATIVGDSYVNGSWGSPRVDLDVVGGQVLWKPASGGCPAPPPGLSLPAAPAPAQVKVFPLGYGYGEQEAWFTCATTGIDLPSGPPVSVSDEPTSGGTQIVNPPALKVGAACRIFSPGVYTDKKKLTLASVNYFKKGVYVLAFGNEWKIDKYVTGGRPWVDPEPDPARRVPGPVKATAIPDAAADCKLAENAPDEIANPNGVRWLMAGGSRLKVGANGKLELYPLVDAAHPESPSGTLQALNAEDVMGWNPQPAASTVEAPTPILTNDTIVNTEIGIHGVLYAPRANLTFLGEVKADGKTCDKAPSAGSPLAAAPRSCINSVLKVLGSVVVRDLDLNVSYYDASATNKTGLPPGKLGIDSVAGSGFTRFVLTATSRAAAGARTIRAVANVAMYNTSPVSMRVESWRVTSS